MAYQPRLVTTNHGQGRGVMVQINPGLRQRLLCAVGAHSWKPSMFQALNQRGPSYVCQRCGKYWFPAQ